MDNFTRYVIYSSNAYLTSSLNQQHTETGSDEYTTVVDGFAPYVVFEREVFECVDSRTLD